MTNNELYPETGHRYTYRSHLVDQLRASGEVRAGHLRLLMPQSLGFCWGVDRALAMVQDAREKFPDRRIWLLNSIIHNPKVNADMREFGIRFLKGKHAAPGALEELAADDVVIVPAFSAMIEEMQLLAERGCEVVDTTCPWVIKPHKRAEKYVREGYTTIIHGTVGHDETRSTCSLVTHRGGHFLVLHDLGETDLLANFLRGQMDASELIAGLHPGAASDGFRPESHLDRIGLINQTTMLASESREIGDRLKSAMDARMAELGGEFLDFDTICRATQDNQDATSAMVAESPDLFLVVGGFDSSNTNNLARVGDAVHVPAYHIDGPTSMGEILTCRERPSGRLIRVKDWLPKDGPVTVAFTAGASTPDTVLAAVVQRVVELAGAQLPGELRV